MPPNELVVVSLAAAAAAAAVVVVLRQHGDHGVRHPRAVGALVGVVGGTMLWWLSGAFVLWIVFLALGGLIGLGIERAQAR